MQEFRFIHAADLHIDSPFKGLKSVNPTVSKALQEATFQAFENLVNVCLERRVDFLLIAGDVYDGADRAPRSQLRFLNGLKKLSDAGVDAFVVHGNHDPLNGQYSRMSWPERVHTFKEVPSWVTASRGNIPIANIQGVSYPRSSVVENLLPGFVSPPLDNLFKIGLLHCNVGGNSNHDNYAPCTVDDLCQMNMDYWALGHIHTRQTLKQANPTIVYPGNIQGRHPGETGPHGCVLVEVDQNGSVGTEFIQLDVVRWESIEVSIENIQGIDDLVNRITDRLVRLQSGADGRDVVCRVTLSGRGPLHGQLVGGNTISVVEEEIRLNQSQESPWIWLERLSDKTFPEIDLEHRANQDDFLGSILREVDGSEPDDFRELLAEVFSGRRHQLKLPEDDAQRKLLIKEWMERARWILAEKFSVQE